MFYFDLWQKDGVEGDMSICCVCFAEMPRKRLKYHFRERHKPKDNGLLCPGENAVKTWANDHFWITTYNDHHFSVLHVFRAFKLKVSSKQHPPVNNGNYLGTPKVVCRCTHSYSQTCASDHLLITTICLQRPPFCGPVFILYSIKLPLNNDHMSTTATNLGSQVWSLTRCTQVWLYFIPENFVLL